MLGQPDSEFDITLIPSVPLRVERARLPEGESEVSYFLWSLWDFPYKATEPSARQVNVRQGQTTDVTFVLRPLPALLGRVVLPDGRPAAGAQVGLLSEVWRDSWEQLFRTRTDSRGNFRRPLGSMEENHPYLALTARDPARGLAGLIWLQGGQKSVTVQLGKGAYFQTDVRDAAGRAVADRDVELLVKYGKGCANFCTERTGGEGRLRIGPLPSGVPLEVSPAGGTATPPAG